MPPTEDVFPETFSRFYQELDVHHFASDNSEASPRSTKLLYNVGAVSEQRGDLARADLSYKSVLRLQPNFEQAIAGLANIRLRLNAPREAAQLYQKALSITPEDAGAVTNYAASLAELGDPEGAEREYTSNCIVPNER
jgi:tetratricopeptide (TPR) repeat protein